MEFLRRLRFVWAALCLVAALACAVAYVGVAPQFQNTALAWAGAALFGAFGFYIDGPLTRKLSVVWLGGVGLFAAGATQVGGSGLVVPAVAGVAGIWAVVAVLVWLARGLVARPRA